MSRKAVLDMAMQAPIVPVLKGDTVHYERIIFEDAVKNLPSVQPQTVDWDAMIEEIKEETIPMIDAEENDYWDVKYGLFEEDILEIINKYRNGERNE